MQELAKRKLPSRVDETLFPRVFHDSALGMVACEIDGTIIKANEAAAKLLGIPRHELEGSNGLEILQPRERAISEQHIRLAEAGEFSASHEEYHYVRPDGAHRWFVSYTSLVERPNGKPYGLSLFQDITPFRAAQQVARRSAKAFRLIFDTAPVAIYSVGLDGRVLTWNPMAAELFGWSALEVVGHPIPIVPADAMDEVEGGRSRLLAGEDLRAIEFRAVRKDGSHVDVITSASPMYDDDGTTTAFVAFAMDATERRAAEALIQARDRRFLKMVDNLTEVVLVVGTDLRVIDLSTPGEVLGYDAESFRGFHLFDIVHPDDHHRAEGFAAEVLATLGVEYREVFRVRHRDGMWVWVDVVAVNLSDDPDIAGIVVTTRDINEHKRNEGLLASQADILELIARGSALDQTLHHICEMVQEHAQRGTSAIVLLDETGRMSVAAGALPPALESAIEGCTPHEKLGSCGAALSRLEPVIIDDIETDPLATELRDLLRENGIKACWSVPIIEPSRGEAIGTFVTYFAQARPPSEHEQHVADAAANLADIAIERARSVEELSYKARHDLLTGLPNRNALIEHLTMVLERAHAEDTSIAVMFLDLDRFKIVNDSMGHAAGDQLLLGFAERLRAVVRPADFVGRFEGDEFVVALEHIADEADIRPIVNRLELALSEPFVIEGGEVYLATSIGVAISHDGVESANELLQYADAAVYRAKQTGKNRLEIYDDAMRSTARERLQIERDLRQAIERAELMVHYQPKIDLVTGSIIGAEALLRWNHPERGMVSPTEFVPIAEETGLIMKIGRFVLEEAVLQGRTWSERGAIDTMKLSVNLSARQLTSVDLVPTVAAVLDRHGWAPEHLILELTESMLIENTDTILNRLHELKQLGVLLAIDDFGTGYSSLAYIDQLPVDIVKIDRAFVARLKRDGSGSVIVSAVLHMANELGLIVLAEGVEELEQLQGLRLLGCHWGQGFHFAKAVPSEELNRMLVDDRRW